MQLTYANITLPTVFDDQRMLQKMPSFEDGKREFWVRAIALGVHAPQRELFSCYSLKNHPT